MKDFLEWLEKWFDGKKTIIGVIATLSVTYLYSEMIIDNYTAQFLAGLAGALFGAGVNHKAVKYRKKTK
jgi:hypothetical protein